MTRYFTNNFPVINLHKNPSTKSEIVTQMIYGESFSIYQKNKEWLKIKIKEDNYTGYIKNKRYSNYLQPTHKVSVLKADIFRHPNKKTRINQLTFNSKVKITDNKNRFFQFKGGWISKDSLRSIKYTERNFFKKINIFKNVIYKWGGKSFKGIDCSALIQICLNFNNKFCPRDAKDQVKYFKKNINIKKLKKNDIIYWKGHVAVVISKKKLIHAYGPYKKTVIMDISKTIKLIKKTANLKVLSCKRIKL